MPRMPHSHPRNRPATTKKKADPAQAPAIDPEEEAVSVPVPVPADAPSPGDGE
jgi:hypothetical protein